MIYIKAEMGIDDDSIIAQIERVRSAETKLKIELDELNDLFYKIKIREKGTPESPQSSGQDFKKP